MTFETAFAPAVPKELKGKKKAVPPKTLDEAMDPETGELAETVKTVVKAVRKKRSSAAPKANSDDAVFTIIKALQALPAKKRARALDTLNRFFA